MMGTDSDNRGFVWYELVMVVILVSAFALLVIPRFLKVRQEEDAVRAREVLQAVYDREKEHLRKAGSYGGQEHVLTEDLGRMVGTFHFTVENVSESTFVAMARQGGKPHRFLSVNQDSVWDGNLLPGQ